MLILKESKGVPMIYGNLNMKKNFDKYIKFINFALNNLADNQDDNPDNSSPEDSGAGNDSCQELSSSDIDISSSDIDISSIVNQEIGQPECKKSSANMLDSIIEDIYANNSEMLLKAFIYNEILSVPVSKRIRR